MIMWFTLLVFTDISTMNLYNCIVLILLAVAARAAAVKIGEYLMYSHNTDQRLLCSNWVYVRALKQIDF